MLGGRWVEMALSPEGDAAALELRSQGETRPAGGFEQRHVRAELLLKGKRYNDAVSELSTLVEQAPTEKLTEVQLDFAGALYHARKSDEARHLFEDVERSQSASVDQKAHALYFLAELARDKDDRNAQVDLISQLRTLSPDTSWLQEALLSAGNMCMLQHDYETGARFSAGRYPRQP